MRVHMHGHLYSGLVQLAFIFFSKTLLVKISHILLNGNSLKFRDFKQLSHYLQVLEILRNGPDNRFASLRHKMSVIYQLQLKHQDELF